MQVFVGDFGRQKVVLIYKKDYNKHSTLNLGVPFRLRYAQKSCAVIMA